MFMGVVLLDVDGFPVVAAEGIDFPALRHCNVGYPSGSCGAPDVT